MGSAIGYSTIWLATGGRTKRKSTTTPTEIRRTRSARGSIFAGREWRSAFTSSVGDALELLKKAPGKFDLIFNDVNKHQYPDALRVALPKLRRGGLLITDNTLVVGQSGAAGGSG